MKLLFVAIGSEQLGISQLASIVKSKGHDVGLVFTPSLFHDRYNLEIPWLNEYFDETEDIVQEIIDQKPDVIAFSCITATFQWAISIARLVRKSASNIKTIFGGVHVSAVPDICLSYSEVDYVVVGEGDRALCEILNDIGSGGFNLPIVNTRYLGPDGNVVRGPQEGFYQHLDDLPFPDKTIWEPHINLKDNYLMMASRGCPYTCSFCFNNFFARLPDGKRGKYVRQRSVQNVITELKWAKDRYRIKAVNFQDDVFTVNKGWILEFCEAYKREIDLPFNCLIHPQYFDEEIAEKMRWAGCEWIQMGIQTMDENFKHQNLRRYEDSQHIVNALRLLKKYKFKIKVDHMLGLPGEAIESQETALKLYKEYTPDRIQTFWTCFLPGTDMMTKGILEGRVTEEQASRINHGHEFYFFRNQDNIDDPELVRQYVNYEFIYRMLPATPDMLKKYLVVEKTDKLPEFLKNFIGRWVDFMIGVKCLNVDFVAYGKFYAKSILKYGLKKIGYKKYNISKVYSTVNEPALSKEPSELCLTSQH